MAALLSTKTQGIRKVPFQPEFPLKYSGAYGPYKPITSMEQSIKKNFEYLLLTEPGEWPMEPTLGVGLKRYLFEDYESLELKKLQERIESQIERFTRNIKLLSVRYSPSEEDKDQNYIKVVIRYTIFSSLVVETTATPISLISVIDDRLNSSLTLSPAAQISALNREIRSIS